MTMTRPAMTTKTGSCLCGCGRTTKGQWARGHDRIADAKLTKLLHGNVANRLAAAGFGPGGKNLHDLP